jgi:hypothetical protein
VIEEIFGSGHRSLFMVSLFEPRDNFLSVVLLEAAARGREEDVCDLGLTGRETVPLPQALAIEIEWADCILYSVGNETYMTADPSQQTPPARMLVERTGSRFLDYVCAATWARDERPGAIRHWALFCENHTVDVACLAEPIVRRVPVAPQWLDRDRPRVFQR